MRKRAPNIVNKKARMNYHILDVFDAGLELKGCEVKSLRNGDASLAEAYCKVNGMEVFLVDCHISPYVQGSYNNPPPTRPRKLLLHKIQIKKLYGKVIERGMTLIPLKIYFNSKGWAKIQIALAKGKPKADRRAELKERDLEREARRALREFSR